MKQHYLESRGREIS